MIRVYKNADRESCIKLLELNMPKYFAIAEKKDFIEYLDKYLEDYFVVEIENTIVGAGGINYFEKEKVARISWDFFYPNMQGKGWGKKLVEYRISKIKLNPDIEIAIVRTSQHAHKFYEKCGFTLIEKRKDFWGIGFDLYEMKMKL